MLKKNLARISLLVVAILGVTTLAALPIIIPLAYSIDDGIDETQLDSLIRSQIIITVSSLCNFVHRHLDRTVLDIGGSNGHPPDH